MSGANGRVPLPYTRKVEKMCVAVPGKVISVDKDVALLDFWGVRKEVSTALLTDIKPGDYLLVHAGCAIQKVSMDEAEEILKLFEEING